MYINHLRAILKPFEYCYCTLWVCDHCDAILPTTNRIKNISIDFSCSSSADAGAGSSVVFSVVAGRVVIGIRVVVPLLMQIVWQISKYYDK